MFVAVVYKYHADTDPKSHKEHGGWESFLGNTKEEAIEQAILWARRWESAPKTSIRNPAGEAKYYGPYTVLVGELTEEAKRTEYTLSPIGSKESLDSTFDEVKYDEFADPDTFEDVPF